MEFKTRLKGALIGVLICALALPASFIITFMTFPFWRWIDITTEIEAFGHSGPAEWCFWLVYGMLLVIATVIWYLINKEDDSENV